MRLAREDFRDQLLEMETPTPALREQYEQQVKAMIEPALTQPRRRSLILSLVVGAVLAVYFALMGYLTRGSLPALATAGLVGAAVYCGLWALFASTVLRTGTFNRRTYPVTIAAMVWALAIFLAALLSLTALRAPPGNQAAVLLTSGLVFLITAAVVLVCTVIEKSQIRTESKMLELEYRLAELMEELRRR